MPTAIVSSVKQPVGIYLTAGWWTKIEPSPCLESPLLVFALSSLLFHFSPPPPAPPPSPHRPSPAPPDQLHCRQETSSCARRA